MRQILVMARRREVRAPWVEALADCIAANEDELSRGVVYEGGFPQLAESVS
jgi:hypothetical protein